MPYPPQRTYDDYILLGDGDGLVFLGTNLHEAIAGNRNDDYINGGGGEDLLLGNDGNDSLDGGNSKDILFGGKGNDFVNGGAGADWLTGDAGMDQLRGGSGADFFFFNAKTAGLGSDTIQDFSFALGDKLEFGKYTGTNALSFTQNGANVEVYVDLGNNGSNDYLAVTVLNAAVADVAAASSFVM